MSKEKADKEIERYITVERDGETFAVDNPEYVKKIQNEKYEYFLNKSNIPNYYYNIGFDSYHGDKNNENLKKIRHYAEHCHEEKFRYVSLYLWGNSSTQKTALSCNIGKQAIKNGLKVKFILAGHLVNKLIKISGYSKNEEIETEIEELKEQDLIIVDDLFDDNKSLYFKNNPGLIISELDSFFRDLLSKGTRFVITSNFSIHFISEKYGNSIFELFDRNLLSLQLLDNIKIKKKLNVEEIFKDI